HGGSARAGGRRSVHRSLAGPDAERAALTGVAALERHDACEANLQRGALLAVLALPLAGAQLALGEDLVPLAHPLGGALGGIVPDLDVEPLGVIGPLAGRIAYAVIDRHPQVGHGLAAGGVAQLGI